MGIDRLLEGVQADPHADAQARCPPCHRRRFPDSAWSKQGTNARDLQFFVDYYGYSPAEALLCGTRNGGALMTIGSGEKLGEVKEGYLADLLLVDGDPLADLSILLNS